MREFRWVHLGVVAMLAAAGVTAFEVADFAGAAGGDTISSFVPIVPCRLADTRPGADHVGTHDTLVAQVEAIFNVWGPNGNCTIPSTATGIAANITAVNPTATSYLTVFPSDAATRPLSSNLNWTAASSATPNQVTVALSFIGQVSAFNNAGSVDIIIDLVGYYVPTAAGPPGPQGEPGLTGIVTSQDFNSAIGSIVLPASALFIFAGQTAALSLVNGERVVATASASLGKSAGTIQEVAIGICVQSVAPPNSPIILMSGVGTGEIVSLTGGSFYNPVSATAAADMNGGTYNIGLCVRQLAAVNLTLDVNGRVSGWVEEIG
jgi:hypothetical protein